MNRHQQWLFEAPLTSQLPVNSFELHFTPVFEMEEEAQGVILQSPRFRGNARIQAAANNRPPMRSGERGSAVQILQQALLDLGYPMPVTTRNRTRPPDGIYGNETIAALRKFQAKYGLQVDGIAGRQTWNQLDQLFRQAPPIKPPVKPPIIPPIIPPTLNRVEDRTALTPKDKRKGYRDIKQVYALVLHQMAFSRGNDVKKYDTVTSHFIITPDGKIAQLHPLTQLLWASNGFNKHSVAVEFAGNFPNIKGKCWEAKKFGCHTVTPAQIEAGQYLIRYLVQTIGLTHVLAHRQSSAQRENDPGPDIWYHVGQWAVDKLGLRDGGPGFKVGDGNPIPDSWRTWGRR